jgi:hypothetical protein
MSFSSPIVELDLHGYTADQAQVEIDRALSLAGPGTYKIKCIHGFNHGTAIKNMIYREFGHGLSTKVKRIAPGENQGITELILREL